MLRILEFIFMIAKRKNIMFESYYRCGKYENRLKHSKQKFCPKTTKHFFRVVTFLLYTSHWIGRVCMDIEKKENKKIDTNNKTKKKYETENQK